MRRVRSFLLSGMVLIGVYQVFAQKTDDGRMIRDVAVAENVLSTLIKQEFDKRSFFPMEVKGSYMAGYGVTFTVPTGMLGASFWNVGERGGNMMILDGMPGAFSYSFSTGDDGEIISENIIGDLEDYEHDMEKAEMEMKHVEKELKSAEKEMKSAEREKGKAMEERALAERERERAEKGRVVIRDVRVPRPARAPQSISITSNSDSLQTVTNAKIIQAAKNFIIDYGDMISLLAPEERIVVSNRGANQFVFYGQNRKRSLLSVEALKSDLNQFRQGKITRDQMISKIKITNTESSGKVEPDLELLTSIFSRLYRSDLSKTFFIDGNAHYERLTDFGAIVYMQVYSSNQVENGLFNMPTVSLRGVDQAARDKRVKELYPIFENELKENILDYGRTLKSLADNEQLMLNVKLTRCIGCGIPADVEVSIKSSVLKDYSSGKLDKNSALAKISVKKGVMQ